MQGRQHLSRRAESFPPGNRGEDRHFPLQTKHDTLLQRRESLEGPHAAQSSAETRGYQTSFTTLRRDRPHGAAHRWLAAFWPVDLPSYIPATIGRRLSNWK